MMELDPSNPCIVDGDAIFREGDPVEPGYDLDEYLEEQGIVYFRAREILTIRSIGVTVPVPPIEWWPRIIPTLRIADLLRRRMGHPLWVGAGYRPPKENRRVRGASQSGHLVFRAVDLDLPSNERGDLNKRRFYGEAVDLWQTLGGPVSIGLYSPGGGVRVHLETNHRPRKWGRRLPARRYWKRSYVDGVAARLERMRT